MVDNNNHDNDINQCIVIINRRMFKLINNTGLITVTVIAKVLMDRTVMMTKIILIIQRKRVLTIRRFHMGTFQI